MRALVLGSTGMLGSRVAPQLAGHGIEVTATSRGSGASDTVTFDAAVDSVDELLDQLGPCDYIINAIGVIKSHIQDGISAHEMRALRINALFPHELALAAERTGARVLQIATDCVYSGAVGGYTESAAHDALDVYGKTKSLGEVVSPAVMHLRCSIIGREVERSTSLVEWVLGQDEGAVIKGYTNHKWNGVTTGVFGQLCAGIMLKDGFSAGVQHVVPADVLSKHELVTAIARVGGRRDIVITPFETPQAIDRTLNTASEAANRRLWGDAGFDEIPTVERMVEDLGP